MPLSLPDDIRSQFGAWLSQVRSEDFWWQLGVLALAAIGAMLVHRALAPSLLESADDRQASTPRHLALKAVQRILFPISMLLGVLAGRVVIAAWAIRSRCSMWRCRC